MTENKHTPANHWMESGEPDPHGAIYDCERWQLVMGKLTDDELANGAFMNYDIRPPVEDIIKGKAFSPIAWMTAVKDRIRWLSRRLIKAEKQRDELLEALEKITAKLAWLNSDDCAHIMALTDEAEAIIASAKGSAK